MSEKVNRLELYIVVVALLLAITIAVVNQSMHLSDLRDEVEEVRGMVKDTDSFALKLGCKMVELHGDGEYSSAFCDSLLYPDSTGGR